MKRAGTLALLLAILLPTEGREPALSGQSRASAHLVISTRPAAVVFVNDVRRGVTDARGRLTLVLEPGTYTLRVSKTGYEEAHVRLRLTPGMRRQLALALPPLRDPAERHRQQGDALREQRQFAQAAAEYRKAIALRKGRFPRARLGLARALLALEEPEEALRQVRRAIAESRTPLPEARTLLGNILRAQGLYEDAIREYRAALRQANNFSPEAHAGLALALGELGETEPAIAHMRTAIAQNADAEPILYYLLGNLLLDADRPQEAIAAYETYLRLAPQSETAPAVRSLVEQLRKELASQELR
ncbi:MAG: tetratricopeptide repeat protein [Blastocatellia bacterium]|nr:tetratricopeptide repeat protein [Blastocatellia bacterium]MCS7156599.1 tetratricopeptide repeat protein [Blastocatellia bacterium]MCX7751659.1 tetratricopeptide repeat protein [Blastocatellia bacterium]MDW8168759.1 tetratricopeptide repeat protein [Acidobacteriota bacterium]MDW8257025.1 tetratricopeptide repeat protein [Acidobacteriota bacterium]